MTTRFVPSQLFSWRYPTVLVALLALPLMFLTFSACDDAEQARTCQNNDECPPGQVCAGNRCVDARNPCRDVSECEEGQACVNNVCVDQDSDMGPDVENDVTTDTTVDTQRDIVTDVVDEEIFELVGRAVAPRVLAMTKSDKLSRSRLPTVVARLRQELLSRGLELPIVATSATKKEGRRELWKWVEDLT